MKAPEKPKSTVQKTKSVPPVEKNPKKSKSVVSVAQTKVEKPAAKSVSKPKKEKIVQPVAAIKTKVSKEESAPKAANKKAVAAKKKPEIIVPAVKQKRETKAKAAQKKVEIIVPALKPKPRKKAETIAAKQIAAKPLKNTGKKVGILIPPVTPVKPVQKKIKPISSAVVRGKSGRYDFEVFPIDAELKDGSAIYVISKRVTDKRGRGHHKFVCIGQTTSLLGEIKKHKKDKCIKQHKANVICLLREENEPVRLKIETDLREAHSIACNQK